MISISGATGLNITIDINGDINSDMSCMIVRVIG